MAIGGMLVRDLTRETLNDELENLILPSTTQGEKKQSRNPFRKEGKRK